MARLSRFRRRIGKTGCEQLLTESIQVGVKSGIVKPRDFKRVTVDTTVQEKAVTFPTDSKLLNRSGERLVKLCRFQEIELRQSCARVGLGWFIPLRVLSYIGWCDDRDMRRNTLPLLRPTDLFTTDR